MIDQLQLQDSAGFENSSGEAQIRFGRGRIATRMVVHENEGVSAENDHRLKDFTRVGEGFVPCSLADRKELDELLLGVEKNDSG